MSVAGHFDMVTLAATRVIPPGTMIRYTNVEGERLVGLVIARRPPPSEGAMPFHLVLWSNCTLSTHVYCEPLF